MKVFLDTNVLAGAFATRGLCSDILREVFSFHDLLTCDMVIKELEQVLRMKFGVSAPIVKSFSLFLKRESLPVQSGGPIQLRVRGEADKAIIAAALAGKADVFITGDKELLSFRRVKNMRILSPRQFWDLLRSKHGGR